VLLRIAKIQIVGSADCPVEEARRVALTMTKQSVSFNEEHSWRSYCIYLPSCSKVQDCMLDISAGDVKATVVVVEEEDVGCGSIALLDRNSPSVLSCLTLESNVAKADGCCPLPARAASNAA
jgi:hypothetical protein